MKIDRFYSLKFIRSCGLEKFEKAIKVEDYSMLATVPEGSLDVVVLDFSLNRVFDYESLLAKSFAVLRRGGIIVATMLSIAPPLGDENNLWGFTPVSASFIFKKNSSLQDLYIKSFGNPLSGRYLLNNKDSSELTYQELLYNDPLFSVVTGVKAIKK